MKAESKKDTSSGIILKMRRQKAPELREDVIGNNGNQLKIAGAEQLFQLLLRGKMFPGKKHVQVHVSICERDRSRCLKGRRKSMRLR